MNCPYCHSSNVEVGMHTGQCTDCGKVFFIEDGHPYVIMPLKSPVEVHEWRAPGA